MTKKRTFINPIGRSLVGFLTKEKVAKLTYSKKEAYNANYEGLARQLNVFQANLIGLSTGAKPNLESIKGINQEAFLSTSVINDILKLNNAIEKILKYSKENESYELRAERLEIHLSFLVRQFESINDELKTDLANIEKKEAERVAVKKENDKTKKKEKLQKIATEFTGLLEKKSRVMDAINDLEHDQNDSEIELHQINSLIGLNKILIKELFATLSKIKSSYPKKFLESIFKDQNPFEVEIDHEGLSKTLELK